MTDKDQNFTIYQAETKDVKFTVNSGSLNMTGACLSWRVWDTGSGAASVLAKHSDSGCGINTGSVASGIAVASLVPSDTCALEGNYRHELRVIDASSNENVVTVGTMTVVKSRTI